MEVVVAVLVLVEVAVKGELPTIVVIVKAEVQVAAVKTEVPHKKSLEVDLATQIDP